jgi:hypothetical protein
MCVSHLLLYKHLLDAVPTVIDWIDLPTHRPSLIASGPGSVTWGCNLLFTCPTTSIRSTSVLCRGISVPYKVSQVVILYKLSGCVYNWWVPRLLLESSVRSRPWDANALVLIQSPLVLSSGSCQAWLILIVLKKRSPISCITVHKILITIFLLLISSALTRSLAYLTCFDVFTILKIGSLTIARRWLIWLSYVSAFLLQLTSIHNSISSYVIVVLIFSNDLIFFRGFFFNQIIWIYQVLLISVSI